MSSPTQRSLERLRKLGYVAGVVERWIPGANIRRDFCGGIDVIGFKAASRVPVLWSAEILGVQACSGTSGDGMAKHRAKLLAEPKMREWVAAGGRLVIWAWAKQGAAGKRKLWTCREVELTLADFAATAQQQSEQR